MKRRVSKFIILIILLAVQPLLWSVVKKSALAWHDRRSLFAQVRNLNRLNANLEQTLQQQIQTQPFIEQAVPDTLNIVEQTRYIEILASTSGVGVSFQNIAYEDGENGLPLLRVLFVAIGQPDRLMQYLDVLEHSPRLTRVAGWHLAPSSADASAWQLSAEIEYTYGHTNDNREP